MYERQETIEHNGIKLDVVFEFEEGNYSGGINDPDCTTDEIVEILSIKINGTDIDLTYFLEGELDSQIEKSINLELERQL